MMNVELLIFDLDGTLVDSKYDLLDSLNYAARNLGYQEIAENDIPGLVGDGVRMLIAKAFKLQLETPELQKAQDVFMDYYEQNLTNRTEFFPNVLETIKFFKAKKLAVLSNKPDEFTKPIIKELGLGEYFNFVLGATDKLERKPSGQAIEHILTELGVEATNAIMIGDGDTDIRAGKNAGVKTCGLTYGYRSREELETLQPDWVLDDIGNLRSILN